MVNRVKYLFMSLIGFLPFIAVMSTIVVVVSGCTTKPVVKTEYIVVAAQDNLLVNCEVAEPPKKEDYLKESSISLKIATSDSLLAPLAQSSSDQVIQSLTLSLKALQERERLLSNLIMKHYQNIGACNVRWKAVRDHKAKALKEIGSSPGSK